MNVIDSRRGRPRNESCTGDILIAAIGLVAEVGIAGLTIDAVAAKAGVGKATIYRRWSTKEALMLDAWMSLVKPNAEPDTGALRTDLEQIFQAIEHPVTNDVLQKVFPQMIAAAKVHPDVHQAYHEYIVERRKPLHNVLVRAVARGELPADIDIDVVQDLLIAPVMYRWLITDAPVDHTTTQSIIDVVLAGLASRTDQPA